MTDLFSSTFGELRYEPTARRVRADDVVDSTRAYLVWEPRRIVPGYAVPETDVLAPVTDGPPSAPDPGGVLHPGIPFAVHTTAGTPVTIGGRQGAGFRLDDLPAFRERQRADRTGGSGGSSPLRTQYVALDTAAFEAWYEEDERVFGHPRNPFSRIDVRATSRPVRIELAGEVLAETTSARLLFETGIGTRYYVPRDDVRGELVPTELTTYCPYKGRASYWSLGAAENIAWSYEDPLPDGPLIKGLVAFWDEKVDVFVDGEQVGAAAESMLEEFGL